MPRKHTSKTTPLDEALTTTDNQVYSVLTPGEIIKAAGAPVVSIQRAAQLTGGLMSEKTIFNLNKTLSSLDSSSESKFSPVAPLSFDAFWFASSKYFKAFSLCSLRV